MLPSAPPAPCVPPFDAPRQRVLILDDHAGVRDLVALWLAYARCPTAEAANGEEALALLDDFQPDVILLEVVVRHGMNGWEFLKRYRRRPGPQARVLVFTSFAHELVPPMGPPVDGHVPKPFSGQELLAGLGLLPFA